MRTTGFEPVWSNRRLSGLTLPYSAIPSLSVLLKPGDRAASGNATTQLFTFGRHLDSPSQGTGPYWFSGAYAFSATSAYFIGQRGFEPPTPGTPNRCADHAAPLPVCDRTEVKVAILHTPADHAPKRATYYH
jgi:hypothetical protein